MEEPYDSVEEQTDNQVCYGQLKNKPISPSQSKSTPPQNNNKPNKVTVFKHDQPLPNKRGETKESVCVLCNKPHPTHRCLLTRQIHDGNLKAPQNFCPKHCGKINDLCHNNKCFIIHTQNNKKLNLTCGKTNHGNRHFLICPIEGCRKASEKYWQNQEKKK